MITIKITRIKRRVPMVELKRNRNSELKFGMADVFSFLEYMPVWVSGQAL